MTQRKNFKLAKTDIVSALLVDEDNNLLTSLYDDGYTTKESVYWALYRKIELRPGKRVECRISTNTGKHTDFTKIWN